MEVFLEGHSALDDVDTPLVGEHAGGGKQKYSRGNTSSIKLRWDESLLLVGMDLEDTMIHLICKSVVSSGSISHINF